MIRIAFADKPIVSRLRWVRVREQPRVHSRSEKAHDEAERSLPQDLETDSSLAEAHKRNSSVIEAGVRRDALQQIYPLNTIEGFKQPEQYKSPSRK